MSNQFPEKPKGIEVQHFNDYIKIKYDRFKISNLFFPILGFSGCIVILISFLPLMFGGEFLNILPLIPLLLGGGWILYQSILMNNKTFITVNDKAIIVRHKPIPSNGLDLRLVKLENIFSKVTTTTTKSSNNNQEETIYYYQVYAQTSNDTNKQIIETNNREQMLFIEKTLKDYLNIKDDAQEGELDNVD